MTVRSAWPVLHTSSEAVTGEPAQAPPRPSGPGTWICGCGTTLKKKGSIDGFTVVTPSSARNRGIGSPGGVVLRCQVIPAGKVAEVRLL